MPDKPDSDFVICSLADGNPRPDHAVTQLTCVRCHREIWFSYSSAVAMLGKEYEHICTACADARIRADKARGERPKFMPPTALQASEFIQALRKAPRS